MTEQEELEYLELLELEAKAGGGTPAPAAAAPAPATEVDKMKAAIMGQNKKLGLATGEGVKFDPLQGAIGALDFTGGLARTGAYAVPRAAKAIYEQDHAQAESMQQDLLMALQGQAPTSKEQLEKLGVGELGAVNLPVLGRTTGRGALGLVSDVLTASGASSALKSAAAKGNSFATALRAPEAAVESAIKAGGKKMYQSGLKAADIVGKKFGKGERGISETLLKYNIKGGANSVADQAVELADELAARQKEILAEATARGARVDMGKVLSPLKRDVSKITSGTNTLGVKNAAESFSKELDNLIESGSAIPERVVREGVGEQGALFGQAELPVARPVKQLVVNADEALKGAASGQPQLLPVDDLQRQLELLPNAESARVGAPATYVDESVQFAAQPGQVPLIPEAQMMQPAKTTIIPGREALTASKASEIKTQLANQARDAAYDLFSKSQPGTKLFKRAGNRVRIGVEQSVSKVDPKLAQELKQVNKDLGNILTSKKVLQTQANKELMRNAVTSVDAPLALLAPQAAILKKLADVAKGTAARTTLGSSLYNNPYQYLNATRTGAINVGNGNE